jgi:hypothetical protein
MRRSLGLKLAFVLTILIAAVGPVSAQWCTPTIDASIPAPDLNFGRTNHRVRTQHSELLINCAFGY